MTIHPKVVGTLGGTSFAEAVVVIFLWVLSFWHITVPDDVAAAFATVFGVTLGLIGGYNASSPPAGQ